MKPIIELFGQPHPPEGLAALSAFRGFFICVNILLGTLLQIYIIYFYLFYLLKFYTISSLQGDSRWLLSYKTNTNNKNIKTT